MEAWGRILLGVPDSRLILKNTALGSAANRQWVGDLLARSGVAPDRVRLDGPAAHFAFLQTYGEIDLALDTFPYNGGTTTMEALWQGVPVLTFHGDRWASRISASLLRSAGLHEFVAADLEEYVRRAMELAGAGEMLDARRRTMRAVLVETPACATQAFAREMEAVLARLWEHRRTR
jgi:predicted O-linked N-acetylglucosamine transferase (SPINDLY family)